MAENKTHEEKLSQLQMYEQRMQTILVQKQQFQTQLNEVESALSELQKSITSYKIIGNIMVSTNKEDLINELEGKKSSNELRIKTLQKQVDMIKEQSQKLQKEVMSEMNKE